MMQILKKITILFLIIMLFAWPNFSLAASENLDETVARKSRHASVIWDNTILEDPSNAYIWQPETLSYKDVLYGSEVWKLTNTPSGKNQTQDISTTHWSASGNRLIFQSVRKSGAFWIYNGSGLGWMLTNTDGSHLRPPIGASALTPTWDLYAMWSPILDDVLYQPASNDGQSGTRFDTLYRMLVGDNTVDRQSFLTIPGSNQRITLRKSISGDGRKIMIKDANNDKFYPASVYPESAKALDSANGYSTMLDYDWYWGKGPDGGTSEIYAVPTPSLTSAAGQNTVAWSNSALRLKAADINSVSGNGAVVTVITKTAHNLTDGDLIKTTNANIAGYNADNVSVTVVDSLTFTYLAAGTGTPTTMPIIYRYYPAGTTYNVYWANSGSITKANGTLISDVTSPFVHAGISTGVIYWYIITAVENGTETVASNAVRNWANYHDQFLAGATNGEDGIWYYLMPENTSGDWWRARTTGSGPNGEPTHAPDHSVPYSWGGEIEPVVTYTGGATTLKDPWNILGYPSHFTVDRWGRYIIFSKSNNNPLNPLDKADYETSLADTRTHNYWDALGSFLGTNQLCFYEGATRTVLFVSHHDWEGWSDWSTSSGGPNSGNYLGYKVTSQNYRNPDSQRSIASVHTRENGNATTYEANARPTESPDGTKILFSSTFTNAVDDQTQLFWAVAYYPYAPEIKSASKNGANVNLVWDFNQGLNCSNDAGTTPRTGPTPNLPEVNGIYPRTYATRGWPHEALDCAPSPREIKDFRIWSSDNNLNWTPIGIAAYNNCKGTNECGMWTENSWNFNATQASNTTKYYAITSLEHSGLESHTLSNTWKVATDNNGNIIENIEQNSYPADPGGRTTFFPISPDAPMNIAFVHNAGMQYTINWNAPANKELIRYYNIYASDGSLPTAVQQRRIASIPATSDYTNSGSFKYIDWAGNPDASTQYLVTSVDFQGNESGIVTPTDVIAPSAPSGLSVL
ncbi:MAG: hypothetical protein WCG01_00200 [bacterium]